jgi:hypothetical protein
MIQQTLTLGKWSLSEKIKIAACYQICYRNASLAKLASFLYSQYFVIEISRNIAKSHSLVILRIACCINILVCVLRSNVGAQWRSLPYHRRLYAGGRYAVTMATP